jgi:hypothetical protein
MSAQNLSKVEKNCLIKVINLTREVLEHCKNNNVDVTTYIPHGKTSFYKGYRALRNMILLKKRKMYQSVLSHLHDCGLHYWYMSHKEIMIDMWRRRCLFATELCKTKSIQPSDYFPKWSISNEERKLYQMLLQYRAAHHGVSPNGFRSYDNLINDYRVYPEIDNMIKHEYGFTKWLSNIKIYDQKEYYYTIRRIRSIVNDEEIELTLKQIRQVAKEVNTTGKSDVLPYLPIDLDMKPERKRSGKVVKIKILKQKAKELGIAGYSKINLKNHKDWAETLGINV